MCEKKLGSLASVFTCRYSVRRGRGANGARAFGGPPKGRVSNPGRFRRVLIATCSFTVTRRGTVPLSFTTKTTSLPPGFPMRRFYSSKDDGSGEDEDPWIPRPFSLPSEAPMEGRVGYFMDQEYREGYVEEEV